MLVLAVGFYIFIKERGEIMKKFNEMTKKDIEQKLEELELHNQEVFIDKLLTDVEFLQEKAIKTSYKPTNYERTRFNEIHKIITSMMKWF